MRPCCNAQEGRLHRSDTLEEECPGCRIGAPTNLSLLALLLLGLNGGGREHTIHPVLCLRCFAEMTSWGFFIDLIRTHLPRCSRGDGVDWSCFEGDGGACGILSLADGQGGEPVGP